MRGRDGDVPVRHHQDAAAGRRRGRGARRAARARVHDGGHCAGGGPSAALPRAGAGLPAALRVLGHPRVGVRGAARARVSEERRRVVRAVEGRAGGHGRGRDRAVRRDADGPRQGADAEAQEGADEAAPEEGKRNRTATKKTEPTLGASVPIPTHITFTGDLPDSSDEDAVKPHTAAHAHAMYAQLCRANKHGDPPVPVPPTVMQYNPTHSHILSDMPKLWPVELSCAAKPLVSWAEQDRLKRKLEEETAAAEAIAAAEAAATIAASAPPTKTSKKARH